MLISQQNKVNKQTMEKKACN